MDQSSADWFCSRCGHKAQPGRRGQLPGGRFTQMDARYDIGYCDCCSSDEPTGIPLVRDRVAAELVAFKECDGQVKAKAGA